MYFCKFFFAEFPQIPHFLFPFRLFPTGIDILSRNFLPVLLKLGPYLLQIANSSINLDMLQIFV
ncbi:hypothetical protein CHCC14596_2514 [Bacillus licheniformis]|nr:hypothetical protein CHCC14596_2514 [Bacillus licheniformis]